MGVGYKNQYEGRYVRLLWQGLINIIVEPAVG